MKLRGRAAEGNTPLDELRRLLDQAGDRVGGLERGTTGDALKLLRMLDDIDRLYNELAAAEVDLRAEESRRETIDLGLRRKASHVLRLLRPEGGIAALRQKRQPPQAYWWWRLDEYVAVQRRKAARGLVTSALVAVVLLAAAALIYRLFLQPDPAVVAQMEHVAAVERAVDSGDLNGALAAAEAGSAEFPENTELLLWRAVLLGQLGRTAEAEQVRASARALYTDEAAFLIASSEVRLRAGDLNGAYAEARQATTLAPDNAYAYLALGGAHQARGEINAASDAFGAAARLAAEQKNVELEAVAKVRLAMLLQMAPMAPQPAQPSPTP